MALEGDGCGGFVGIGGEPWASARRGGLAFSPAPTQAPAPIRTQNSFLLCPRADSRPSQISGFFCDPPTSVSAPALLGIWTVCPVHPRKPRFTDQFRLTTVRMSASHPVRPCGLQSNNKGSHDYHSACGSGTKWVTWFLSPAC